MKKCLCSNLTMVPFLCKKYFYMKSQIVVDEFCIIINLGSLNNVIISYINRFNNL